MKNTLTKTLTKEIKAIIKEYNLNCSIKEFPNKAKWVWICRWVKLSEEFIRAYQDEVHWSYITRYQKLSEEFITKYKNKVEWYWISSNQKLSEPFIEKFKDEVHWYKISCHQKLSEKFIAKHQDKVNWPHISANQQLGEQFIEKYRNRVSFVIYNECHKTKTLKQKQAEVGRYAKKYNLKYDDEYLYAFREHNIYGSGIYSQNTYYKKGKYYRDWHCDMREDEENSFGLGIFSKGNTPVKVKITDWGLEVNRESDKCRVWGFEII